MLAQTAWADIWGASAVTAVPEFQSNGDVRSYTVLGTPNGNGACSLPIESGVVEAACKTLVSQRLKRAGMRWRTKGGQAILTCRALCQSAHFERAWPLLVQMYQRSVRLPQKVIAFSKR